MSKRLSILLYNAILLLLDSGMDRDEILEELGMSEEEYTEVYESYRDNI